LNEDFQDLLNELLDGEARFLVVGAHAMAVHGVPRATGDMDVWISPEPSNAERVWAALQRFGAPIEQLGDLSGLDFDEAWSHRTMHSFGPREVPFLGRDDLIRNKRATGRPKDIADLDVLEGE
jgi:hypothetical protein